MEVLQTASHIVKHPKWTINIFKLRYSSKITRLHQSTAESCPRPLKISGAKYPGVPHIVYAFMPSSLRLTCN